MNREQAGMDKQDILNYSRCPDKTGIFVFMNQSVARLYVSRGGIRYPEAAR